MRRLSLPLIYLAAAFAPFANADQAATLAALRSGCADDVQRLCAGVSPGGGRIVACLKDHKSELSDSCKRAASGAAGAGDNSTVPVASPTPAPPARGSGASSLSSATPSATTAASAAPAAASPKGLPGSYLRLKRVQIIDPGMAQVQASQPAFDLLIPSDWALKSSNVLFGGGKGGCFSDMFAVYWDAENADGSVAFQGAPDYSWQYADDPAVMKKLSDPYRRQLGGNSKPCPTAKPMKAEEYLRQYAHDAGRSTVIAVEPFPELNQLARKRLGLPAGNGTDGAGTQTEAVRVHFEFEKDGKMQESWLAVAMVTRSFRAGRGMFYDCRAIDMVGMRAPKGKLVANDKLFKVMTDSVRIEPKWQAYSNGIIAKLYSVQAQKEAVQDKAIADFQRHVADTVNGVTANQMRGANNSAFGADQNVRGVQTFRDPSSGKTMELSNLYDHAWLNGSNEYIMSDDPNFNPNGKLTGDWNQLQPVKPAP